MTPGRLIPSLLTLSLCAIAAVTDVRTGRIPNRLVAWGLGLGAALPVASALVSAPPEGVLVALVRELGAAFAGLLVTAAVPLVLFSMRALGGGDVKLFAAVGALAGPGLGFAIVSHSFFFAVPLALVIWIQEGRLWAALGAVGRLARGAASRTGGVRRSELTRVKFAPAILLAAAWVLLWAT